MTDERVRLIASNGELRACLYLVKNGVPFDVAFSLEQHEVTAWTIIFGEMEGNVWDWNTGDWKKD